MFSKSRNMKAQRLMQRISTIVPFTLGTSFVGFWILFQKSKKKLKSLLKTWKRERGWSEEEIKKVIKTDVFDVCHKLKTEISAKKLPTLSADFLTETATNQIQSFLNVYSDKYNFAKNSIYYDVKQNRNNIYEHITCWQRFVKKTTQSHSAASLCVNKTQKQLFVCCIIDRRRKKNFFIVCLNFNGQSWHSSCSYSKHKYYSKAFPSNKYTKEVA